MIKKFFVLNFIFIVFISLFNKQLNAQKINCLDCHENVVEKTVHDKVIKCEDCHNDVVNEDHAGGGKVKKVECKKCHLSYDKQVKNDVHHKLINLSDDKSPNCKLCHGTHKIINPSSLPNKEKYFCGKCHKNNVLLATYHDKNNANESCTKCHTNKNHQLELTKSVHKNLTCANCHSYVIKNIENHKNKPKDGILADCYLCHTSIAREHKESIHGISLSEGINEAAQCWNCHGSHDIDSVKSSNSKVSPKNLVATCGKCHDNADFIKKYNLSINQPGKLYMKSIHGKLVNSGNKNAPSCVTCHGKHDIKNRVQEGSLISSYNMVNTCEKCHKEIAEDFKKSVHWIAVKKGIRLAPSCNDCHSEHGIQAVNTNDKRKTVKKIQDNSCLVCHQNLLLAQRFGMENKSVSSYQDSYHGLVSSKGGEKVAMCVDCHGVHKILPKDHAESTINQNNIVKTCKKCHIEATEIFANSYSHTTQDNLSAKIESIVKKIYIWLIVVVIGWMFLHNLLILIHEIKIRRHKSENEIKIPRFTKNELIQHTILLTTFILLALTGFQLKYPDSVYSELMYKLGLNEVVRRWVHRTSAIIMIGLSIYHVIYLIFTNRGRDVLKGLLPAINDIKHLFGTMAYYMHLTKKHPDYDNYNYIEKMEYWALIWGTIVMGITGFVLWFPTIVGNWAPLWFIKVSEIIHFYEAILATLAIIIWHWFFVIFHPKEYPVSFTVFDGKMSVKHYKDEHRIKYHNVILEYIEFKNGKRTQKTLGNYTKLFINAIENHGISMDEFVKNELENDKILKGFITSKTI